MEDLSNEYIKSRPQRLCNMCGKCCRTIIARKSYAELLELSKQGDKDAIDFLKIFEPYPSIAEALIATPDVVDNIIQKLDGNAKIKNLTFYKCKHLSEHNLCKIYNERPDSCKLFPSTPWTLLPPGCGFEGWLFEKREEEKQIVRKSKENLLSIEAILNTADEKETAILNAEIKKIKKFIASYDKYGSADW